MFKSFGANSFYNLSKDTIKYNRMYTFKNKRNRYLHAIDDINSIILVRMIASVARGIIQP